MHMVEKILNNTTPYGKIRASHEGLLHSSTLILKKVASHNSCMRRDGIVVNTSRCGQDNPGSNPGHDSTFLSHGIWVWVYSVTYE